MGKIDKAKEQYKQKKHEQLEFESQMAEKIANEKAKKRQNYEKNLRNEKIELLKMKQNNTDESDIIPVEVQEEVVELTFKKKISNFFYHNKWWLGLFCVFAFIGGFLIYDLATKKNPDVIILFFEDNDEIDTTALNDYISQFCEDFNGDGKIISDIYYIPYDGDDYSDYSNGTTNKIIAEMQTNEAMIVICNQEVAEAIEPDYSLQNLEEIYPDNENIKEYGFYLKNTDLAEKISYSGTFDDDVYIGIRKPQSTAWASLKDMQEAYDENIVVLDRIIQDLS